MASSIPVLAGPAVERSSTSLRLRTKLALRKRLPRPWQVVRPSKLRFVGCADRATCPRLVCACHPWRDCEASLNSSLAILGKSFGPQKATLRRLRRPGNLPSTCLCMPSLAQLRGFAKLQPCHPWQVVRPSKSYASSAAPTGPHPLKLSTNRLTPSNQLCRLGDWRLPCSSWIRRNSSSSSRWREVSLTGVSTTRR